MATQKKKTPGTFSTLVGKTARSTGITTKITTDYSASAIKTFVSSHNSATKTTDSTTTENLHRITDARKIFSFLDRVCDMFYAHINKTIGSIEEMLLKDPRCHGAREECIDVSGFLLPFF